MDFYKVIDKDGLIRIEAAEGARITVRQERDAARLLSVYVPDDMRRKGTGSALLALAEKECIGRGAKYMEAAFSDEQQEIPSFLEASGYMIDEGPEMISFERKALFGKKEIELMLMEDYPGTVFKGIGELNLDEYKAMYRIINRLGLGLTWDDICTFSRSLSGVLFDEKNRPQVVVFCSLCKKVLTIEVVGAMPKTGQKYVLAAFAGLVLNIIENAGINSVKKIVGIVSDPGVKLFVKKIAEKGVVPQRDCGTCYAKKELTDAGYEELEQPEDALTEGKEILWHKEVHTVRNQPNIGWKVCWMKHKK